MEREISVKELIEAIRKNGFKKAKRVYYRRRSGSETILYSTGKIISACAFGQAGYNLGIEPDKLKRAFDSYRVRSLGTRIVELNDNTTLQMQEIADRIESDYADILDQTVTIVS